MKRLNPIALLALAGLGLMGARSHADPLTYAQGDLLLGFRASGGTGSDKCYVVNVGPASIYTGASSSFTVSGLGNTRADLDATFGTNWNSRSDVFWSVSGTNTNLPTGTVAGEPARTLFAAKAQTTPGILNSVPWARNSNSTQGIPAGKMVSLANYFAYVNGDLVTARSSTANSPKGSVQNKLDVNSYASYMPGGTPANSGGISYAHFNPSVEGTFASGNTSVLELYRLQPTVSGTAPGELVGLFSIDASGSLTFFPASYSGSGGVSGGNATLQFQQAAYAVSETAATVTVTIVRGGNLSTALNVTLDTADGSALGGTDYTAISGQVVSFAANEIQKTVAISLSSNQAGFQPDRDFTVALSGAPGGVTVTSPATVTIEDTTSAPIGFSAATISHTPKNSSGVFQPTITLNVVRNNGRGTASGTVAVDAAFSAGAGFTTLKTTGQAGAPVPPHYTLAGIGAISFADGETSKTITATLAATAPTPGKFSLKLTGATPSGAITATVVTVLKSDVTKPVIVITTPAATVPTPGTFSLSGTVKDDNAQPLTAFTATLNGAAVATTLGAYSANMNVPFSSTGTPQAENGINTLVITATDAQGNTSILMKTFTFSNTVLGAAVAGSYNGVIVPNGTASNDNSGFITVTITGTGSFTGKVTIGGITAPLSGLLRNTGVARFNPAPLKDAFDIIDKVEFDSYLGALTFTASGSQVTGVLSTDATGATALGTFTADKTPFSSTNTLTGSPLLNQTIKGVYNVALPSDVQSPVLAANLYPQGDGVATVTLLPAGSVTFKGYLADGTAFTAAGKLTATNSVALHANLYKKNGSVAGVLQLNLADTDTDVKATNLLWIRPALPRARYYPGGWPNGITVDANGAAYNSPADLDFGQGADVPTGNASLEFSLAGVTGTITRTVNVNSTTGLVKTNPLAGADYKLVLPATTGLFNGMFPHTAGNTPAYKGVLVNKAGGSLNRGYGYFLSIPTTVGYGVTGESGLVKLLP